MNTSIKRAVISPTDQLERHLDDRLKKVSVHIAGRPYANDRWIFFSKKVPRTRFWPKPECIDDIIILDEGFSGPKNQNVVEEFLPQFKGNYVLLQRRLHRKGEKSDP